MKPNNLKKLLAEGKRTVNGWVSIPSSFAAEIYAAQGFESVALDMQHGALDINDVVPLLQAICLSDATPMARVPWNIRPTSCACSTPAPTASSAR